MGVAPVRARAVEGALLGQHPRDDLFQEVCQSCRTIEAVDDIHASAAYRQHLAAVLSRRALAKAAARLNGEVAPSPGARPH
jgi:carbon-monoxide dehydrogenase medium subunit